MEFKKRSKKRNQTRKRTRNDVDGDDNESVENEVAVIHTIEDFLHDQKLRTQYGRREPIKRIAVNKVEFTSTTQYGLHDPKKDGATGQKILHLLDGQFTGQAGSVQRDQHRELMYV